MPAVVALGEPAALAGFRMAGVRVLSADGPDEVRRAWDSLPADVGLVILTSQAAEALPDSAEIVRGPLVVVLPP
jgi:vacuolar-type H+-ATPase subunit F/Vma7